MQLVPREIDKLLLNSAGTLAQRRLARGIRLNVSEATALIATVALERIRDGNMTVAELMDHGRQLLGRRQVMAGVPSMLYTVQVEGTFRDGTKLVTIHSPIAQEDGDLEKALYGSFLPVPKLSVFGDDGEAEMPAPGEVICEPGEITLNAGRQTVSLDVVNTGDRPVQVGSHFPFAETNRKLRFDRAAAYGFRLDIPAGTAVRFEPGERKTVDLVAIGGKRCISGGNQVGSGEVNEYNKKLAMERMQAEGFSNKA